MEQINGLIRKDYKSDADWIQSAINASPKGKVFIPSGSYLIDKSIVVENDCSIELDRGAVLSATEQIDYVLIYKGCEDFKYAKASADTGTDVLDFNRFIKGGTINGNGKASCLLLTGTCCHFTINGVSFLNGKNYGLRVESGYELIANNCYFRTTISGLHGNKAVSTICGDSHYTDIIVVDYTVGFELGGRYVGANRLTRCHVWGGIVPPLNNGELPEMLIDSVAFVCASGDNLLRDCYADTSKIGFDVYDWTRLLGCAFTNNPIFHLDDTVVVRHNNDSSLMVSECMFTKTTSKCVAFTGTKKNVRWINNILNNYDNVSKMEEPKF